MGEKEGEPAKEGRGAVADGVSEAWGRTAGCSTEVRPAPNQRPCLGTVDQGEGSTMDSWTLELYFWFLRK